MRFGGKPKEDPCPGSLMTGPIRAQGRVQARAHVVFDRWVTALDAELDLVRVASLT